MSLGSLLITTVQGERLWRGTTLAWKTMLNKMVKKGAFKRKREQCVTDAQCEGSIFNTNSNGDNI
jgi:hypothetical protein